MNIKFPVILISLIFFISCNPSEQRIPENVIDMRRLNDEQAVSAAKDAYIFGYPLVYSQITKNFMTAGDSPGDSLGASPSSLNSLINYPLTDFKFTNFPYPDAQTYYSCVWLDISQEPVLFEISASKASNANFIVFDAWTNIILNSAEFKDDWKTLNFAIVSKNWRGFLPQDFIEIRSNTDTAFFVYGTKDGQNEKNIKVYALNSRGKAQEKSKDLPAKDLPAKDLPKKNLPAKNLLVKNLPAKNLPKDLPLKQMRDMKIEDFFNMLNALMLNNRPFETDAQTLDALLNISVSPGMRFEPSSFSQDVLEKIKSIPEDFIKETAGGKKSANTWEKMQGLPEKNAGYYTRAKRAFQNIAGIIDGKAVRLISEADSAGAPFDSSVNKYVLRFEENQIPKNKWSIAIYGADGFLMQNQLNRYVLNGNNLKKNSDGSLSIYIQKDKPSKDKENNWLPAPQKNFKLVFKIYPPNNIFEEKSLPPAVKSK